jgi:hypothetical protein
VTVPWGSANRNRAKNYFKLQIFRPQACPENILGLK